MPMLLVRLLVVSALLSSIAAASLPLVSGSTLSPADNAFSPQPAAGLGNSLTQLTGSPPSSGIGSPVSTSIAPPSSSSSSPNSSPPAPPSSSNAQPNLPPGLPGVTTPVNSPFSTNSSQSVPSAAPTVPGTATPLNSSTTGLQNLAPGSNLTEISQGSARNSTTTASGNPPDSGLGGLVTAGIVVASVVLASMIGIFLFRKWKLRPKSRDSRWRTTTLDPFAPTSNLPLHQAMQQHHMVSRNPSLTRSDSGRGMHAGGGSMMHPPAPTVGMYGPPQPHVMQQEWNNNAMNPDMDLMLRHHLRNG